MARIVRLSYADGDVQIDRRTGHGLERAVLNEPIVQGARLQTRENATAEVEFEDGSTLRLTPDTSVEFTALSLRSDGVRLSTVQLGGGMAYLQANNKKDEFSIETGSDQIALKRAARLRVSRTGTEVTLAVFKGEVEVRNGANSVRVKKNETFTANLGDPSKYLLAKGVEQDSYDSWNEERDRYRDSYAANRHDVYNTSYNYGYSDLNYFGNFFNYGPYGTLWRPFGANPYWDPFGDGAWMFYPGYGYMWVSAYPWGWMPYRYGSWVFVPAYGWCWRAATTWNTWYGVPVIYSAPAGYIAPQPPATTTQGTVVVGRGPINTVRSPRFSRWLEDANTSDVPRTRKNAGVTPVPAQPGKPAITPASAPASGTAATTTTKSTTTPTTSTAPTPSAPKTTAPPARPQPPARPPDRTTPKVSGTGDSAEPAQRRVTPAPRPVPAPVPAPAPAPAPAPKSTAPAPKPSSFQSAPPPSAPPAWFGNSRSAGSSGGWAGSGTVKK